MPKENGHYIVFNGVKVFISYFMVEIGDLAFVDSPKKFQVTHWQPLPEPPVNYLNKHGVNLDCVSPLFLI